MRNIEDPAPELKIAPAQTTSKLLRPLGCRRRLIGRLHERNCPGRKNSEHDRDPQQMRRMKQGAPASFLPDDRDHNAIEKYQMNRPFREPAESEKNKRHGPDEPRGFILLPPAQPEDDRERA